MRKERNNNILAMLRKRWDYTQEGLAQEINYKLDTTYGKSAVSKWESGKVKPPVEVLEELEQILGQRDGFLLETYNYPNQAVRKSVRQDSVKTSEFQAGALKFPLFRIVGGDGQTRFNYPNGICSKYHNSRLDLPQDIMDHYHELLNIRMAEAAGSVFEQRNMLRLDDYEIGLSDPEDRPNRLTLHVSLTDYYEMMVTNKSLNTIVSGGKGKLREFYAGDPMDFSASILANPLAVNLSLVTTKDTKIYFARRGKKVATNSGGYGPAVSGTANHTFDFDTNKNYEPFLTAQRESIEEITEPYKPNFSEITFFGLARTMTYYFPFLFGELRLDLTEEDIKSFTPQDNWDIRQLTSIPFTIKDVTDQIKQIYRYMVESSDNGPGTTIFSLYQSLIYQYPDQRDEIIRRMSQP
jgi:transcriptional regulator with XRE-family HTH domain